MTTKETSFVVYSSRDETLSSEILTGIQKANALDKIKTYFEPWSFNDITGKPLITPIRAGIENSPFVVADITFLNLNVVYEIGYAIGRNKRVVLIRSSKALGDRDLAEKVGIFDTLGYKEFSDSDELKNILSSYIDPSPLPVINKLNRQAPVYVIEPPTRTDDVTVMISRLKKARFHYRSFNPREDVRLSSNDAIRQVSSSEGIMVLLQNIEIDGAELQNIRALFVAGLADGMEKPLLILAPNEYKAPLDIRDAVCFYLDSQSIATHVANFCPEIIEYSQQLNPLPKKVLGQLAILSIGDPTAENEMTTLSNYYLSTDQYHRASRGDVNIVVGRKGSGKTALFIQVRNKIRDNKRNVVVDLKPEGYQLVKLKEDVLSYVSEGARQHLITALWKYLILLEIAYKLLEKDKRLYKHNHEIHDLYIALEEAYKVENFSDTGDFSERLLLLSSRLSEQYQLKYGENKEKKLTSSEVTELLYNHDIKKLRNEISAYLNRKAAVWILFDNLDSGWSTQGVDAIDATILRCLIDAGRSIERDMRKEAHPFHSLVFVRNDVYEHIVNISPDYAKDTIVMLDWTDADLLREMLRLRLVAGMEKASNSPEFNFENIWANLCVSHYKGEESSQYLIERSLMRPRNLLKIFNHIRSYAVNFGRQKISEEDIEKGLKAYSQDLLVELDRELTDVFPVSKDILIYFTDSKSTLSAESISLILKEANLSSNEADKILNFLLYYGILGVKIGNDEYFIYDVNYKLNQLKIRLARAEGKEAYLVNPAFWPALNIVL